MNKNLQSPTKLTEFAPIQTEDAKSQTVGQFLSSLFRRTKTSPQEDFNETSESSSDALPNWAVDSPEDPPCNDNQTAPVYTVDITEGRSLPNVLKRISNLLALKSTSLQNYGDTDLKQYWMPDSVSKECYECSEKFTTFRRRHHCRVCGQIFCAQCCNQQITGKIFGCNGDLRVCTYCCKVVLSYLQSPDIGSVLTTDLKILQENLESKFGSVSSTSLSDNIARTLNSNESENTSLKRKISVGYQEEKFATDSSGVTYQRSEEKFKALQNSASLRNIFEEITKPTGGVQFETHRQRLKTYTDCVLGSDLVDWLIFQQKAKNRIQASAICQALLEGGYIESLSEPQIFIDGCTFYRKGVISSPDTYKASINFDVPFQEEPSWVQQIPQECSTTDSDNDQMSPTNAQPGILVSSSSYMLDLNLEANTVYLSRPSDAGYKSPDVNTTDSKKQEETNIVRPSEQLENAPESGWFRPSHLREENGERLAYNLLSEAYEQNESTLLKQLLSSKGLSLSWSDVIIPLIHDITTVIRPDKNHDAVDLDIRNYVKFKILSGGQRSDTSMIGGIVCTKNVAHKGMMTEIENPRILLLQCSIVYQRTEGRLMSIEPVLMQEQKYLEHVATRIVNLQPDIVIVHKNVSRLAQDMLRQHNITLVYNVKQYVIERLSRCTGSDILSAVDTHIGHPKLGTCKRFYLKRFNIEKGAVKTLMFFEGLPNPHLGATVLLRGASKAELTQLKKVSLLFLFGAYNWRLEKSFLMDEFAMPPNPDCELFKDSSKENSPDFTKSKTADFGQIENDVLKKIERTPRKSTKDSEPIGEGKKIMTEAVDDFTDPLHSYNTDEQINILPASKEYFSVAELPFSNSFRKALDDVILCLSPYIVFSVPYLETEMGKKCKLRHFFPTEIYFSEHLGNLKRSKWKDLDETKKAEEVSDKKVKQLHPFLTAQICGNVDDSSLQNLLAHFRACGGTYKKRENISKPPEEIKIEPVPTEKDALDPSNHQRLSVLFCSYSSESNNAPTFCVNPWIVCMDFYGRNDIPLGCFLERYCFRSTYHCPSKSCDTPMVKHIRRFVHNLGCVSIYLDYFDNEFLEEHIVMWTWCTKCQKVSPVAPMSTDSWSYSFAKYLELKFHGDIYSRRGQSECGHSLHHDHYQYFGYKNYVASFKYTSINIWEISLPPLLIQLNHETDALKNQLINDIGDLAQKAHDIFSLILNKLQNIPSDETECVANLTQILSKEHVHFKQRLQEIQEKVTSPTIEAKEIDEKDRYTAYLKVFDNFIRLKHYIVEIVETWNGKLLEATRRKDNDKKKEKAVQADTEKPSGVDDSVNIQTLDPANGQLNDRDRSGCIPTKVKNSENSETESLPPSPKSIHKSQIDGNNTTQNEEPGVENKKESDKKMVKNILSHLLPSIANTSLLPNPFASQEHYISSESSIPIVVFENEPTSIVAFTLNSTEYKRSLEEMGMKRGQISEQCPSPNARRKSNNDKDKIDEDKPMNLLGFLRNKESKTDLYNQSSTSSSETGSDQAVTTPEKADDPKKSSNTHVEVQFQDANCNFFCRVYLAEKFANLRSAVLPIGEDEYIRSLSRSVQWNARGGKSGSNFAKTADDRFILKEMSKSEVQLFLESASNYFVYMNKCYTTKQPTLLGKIVGIYQIVFKNNTNVPHRSHLLVMENLFYNRKVTQKFDLKGSMRNRLVIPDNQEGEIVLLDENLLKMTCDSPLYILPHSKAVLMNAIQNDTEFLSTQAVMDYSLLVGLDPDNKELVLGIIDYIRTFTWDKRLETIFKKSGILGGQGKLPTIVSPEEYQKRFIEAMHRYFLEVPDHWTGLGKGLDL